MRKVDGMANQESEIAQRMTMLAEELKVCRPAFLAMGDGNRQHIIVALLENYGGMRVGELTKRTNLSRPAVSHHLKILKDAGIVSMFKRGTMNFYHVDANESQWVQITALVNHINELVQEVSIKRQAGLACCDNDN